MSQSKENDLADGSFLKPHKAHLLRYVSDEQQEDTNKKALKRYELELLKQKQRREQIEAQLKMNTTEIIDAKNEEFERKRRQIEATRKALDEQYREKEDKKIIEFYENKKYHNTHFGPEETDNTRELHKNKRELEKNLLDQELKTQMANKLMIKETNTMLGKEVEHVYIKQAQKMIENEKNDLKLKKKLQIQKNVKAWGDQKNAKIKLDSIDRN